MYKLTNIKKKYGGCCALDIPSLHLEEGKFYVIYGPNGAGKTTLLNMMSFLDHPDEGEIVRGGGNRGKRAVTMVMQDPYYFRGSVEKNVSLGLDFRSVEKSVIERTIQPVMKELGIWEFRGRDISLLSEGEKKRVAIARAMVLDTKVILLDEITANIDRTHADIIETAVLRLASGAGKTVIMTTHDLNMAYRLTEDVIFLVKGSITDSPLWNVYKADLTGIDSVKKAVLAGGAEIYAATDKTGAVSINIDPRNIIISRHAVDSSALNNLKGKIVSITERNGIIDLVADVKPVRDMKNVKLHIFITCKSFKDMRLGLGEDIFAVFKATAVEVM